MGQGCQRHQGCRPCPGLELGPCPSLALQSRKRSKPWAPPGGPCLWAKHLWKPLGAHLRLTMQVREFSPMKESLSTWVSLLSRNGVCDLFCPRARIHSCRTEGAAEVLGPSAPTSPPTALASGLYLQGQQTLIDLGPFHAGLPIGTACVSPSLVPSQIHQGELAMQLPLGPEQDLEAGMGSGRAGVGKRLP